MSLFGTSMDLKTTYHQAYTEKKGSVIPYSPLLNSNPVSSPWNQYLVPGESCKHLLPTDGVYEDPLCVLHRAYQSHRPNFELIKQKLRRKLRSIYQTDFCKNDDYESKKTRSMRVVLLPPNWTTPLTTQRCSYRDPKSVVTLSTERPRNCYKDNLAPNETEREILRVTTGESDYMANIGALGEFVLREKLHGCVKSSGLSVFELKRRQALLDRGIVGEADATEPTA